MIDKDGFDIVSGWKKDRKDPLSKTIPTKLYMRLQGVFLALIYMI